MCVCNWREALDDDVAAAAPETVADAAAETVADAALWLRLQFCALLLLAH